MSLDHAALARLLDDPRLRRLFAVLDGDGEETRIVGGAIRNVLIGRPVADVDLTTTALPAETERRARAAGLKVVPTGIEHGTLTVIVDGQPFEVTTLREDVETDGRRAVVCFGRDFARDAARRDFTINALSAGPDGHIHDTVGGLADLAARRVRFIGDPATRIREDYLRILRFFRFSADYACGDPDAAGLAAAVRERAGLAILSPERVRTELLRLLTARRGPEFVEMLAQTGIGIGLIGGVGDFGRLRRAAEADAGAADPVLRLAAYGVQTVEDAERLRMRLRLSNRDGDRIAAYAQAVAAVRSTKGPITPARMRALVAEHGSTALTDALAALRGEPGPAVAPEARAELEDFASGRRPVPHMPLRGADLLAAGLPHGLTIGRAMARARALWLDAGCPEGEVEHQRLLGNAIREFGPNSGGGRIPTRVPVRDS